MARAPLIPSLRRWIAVNSRTTQWSALFPGWHSWHLENTHTLAIYFHSRVREATFLAI